jgi:hypothetical protein
MMGTITVAADTLDEALELARDEGDNIALPDNATYISGSWDVATTDDVHIRAHFNGGQEDE